MTAVWVVFAVTGWLAVALLLVAVFAGRVDRNLADTDAPTSLSPLYDQTAEILGMRPEVPFSAGDETDVLQILRQVGERGPELSLYGTNGYRSRRANLVRLPDRGAS